MQSYVTCWPCAHKTVLDCGLSRLVLASTVEKAFALRTQIVSDMAVLRQLVTILLPKSWAIAWSLGRFYSAGAMAHLAGRKQWDFILEADWFERNACCTTSEAQLVGAIKVLQCRLPPSGILTFAPLLHLVDAIAEFLQTGVRQFEIGFSNALHVPKNNSIGRHIKLLRVPRPARVTVAIRR